LVSTKKPPGLLNSPDGQHGRSLRMNTIVSTHPRTIPSTPEFEAAKLYRDVLRRRRMLEDADPADVEAATAAYVETLAAYQAVAGATV